MLLLSFHSFFFFCRLLFVSIFAIDALVVMFFFCLFRLFNLSFLAFLFVCGGGIVMALFTVFIHLCLYRLVALSSVLFAFLTLFFPFAPTFSMSLSPPPFHLLIFKFFLCCSIHRPPVALFLLPLTRPLRYSLSSTSSFFPFRFGEPGADSPVRRESKTPKQSRRSVWYL